MPFAFTRAGFAGAAGSCIVAGVGGGWCGTATFADGVGVAILFICGAVGTDPVACFRPGITGIFSDGVGTMMRGADASGLGLIVGCLPVVLVRGRDILGLSLIHISEPTRLGMISYA